MKQVFLFLFLSLGLQACAVPQGSDSVERRQQALEYVQRGVLAMRVNDLRESEAAFELAEEFASIPELYDGYGCLAFLQGDFAMAEAFYVKAYQVDPSYSNSFGNLALLYDILGNYALAQEYYRRALQQDPLNEAFRNNYALSLYNRAKYSRDSQSGMKKVLQKQAKKEMRKATLLASHQLLAHNQKLLEAY